MFEEQAEGGGGDKIADRIAFLQKTGEEAAVFPGQRFKGKSSTDAPLAPHRDAEQRAQNQENMERRRKRAGQFQYGITKNIDDQGWPPSDAIRHPTEEQSTQRPEGEGEHQGLCDRAFGDPKIARNRGDTEDKDEVIEGIQRPAKETGGKGMTLLCGQGPEWGQKVHRRGQHSSNIHGYRSSEMEVQVERARKTGVQELQPTYTATAALASLERTADYLRRELHLLLRAHSMTTTQYNVLRILRAADAGGLTCSELASRLTGADPDITRLLDRMARHGLVRRERNARDRRAVLTEITEKGMRLLDEVTPLLEARIATLFEHMTPARLALLIDLLHEVPVTKQDYEVAVKAG